MLWASKQLGDILVVGVVWDSGVAAYKGCLPQEGLHLRMKRLRQLGFIDVVIDQRTTDPTPNLERFRPDILTHGSDWERLREGHETLERLGIEFRLIPYTEGISSTDMRQRVLMERDPMLAKLVERGAGVT